MRKGLLGAICVALIITAPQSARAFDGHELLKMRMDLFTTYVAGLFQGVIFREGFSKYQGEASSPLFCPNSEVVPTKDVANAVRTWLRNQDTQTLKGSGPSLVITALIMIFPCNKRP